MAEKKNILTYTGLKKLEDELQNLKVVKRKEVAIDGTKFVKNLTALKQLHPELDEVALRKEYIIQKGKEKQAILKGTNKPVGLDAEEVLEAPDASTYNKLQFRPMHRIRSNEPK